MTQTNTVSNGAKASANVPVNKIPNGNPAAPKDPVVEEPVIKEPEAEAEEIQTEAKAEETIAEASSGTEVKFLVRGNHFRSDDEMYINGTTISVDSEKAKALAEDGIGSIVS